VAAAFPPLLVLSPTNQANRNVAGENTSNGGNCKTPATAETAKHQQRLKLQNTSNGGKES
jgi:hypothetical protein